MNKFQAVRQQLQPLFPIDQNCQTKFQQRNSPYCDRIRQLQQRSQSSMKKQKPKKSFILCMGETSRLNNFLIKPKNKYAFHTHTRHKTLQTDISINFDISPWENYSPRNL